MPHIPWQVPYPPPATTTGATLETNMDRESDTVCMPAWHKKPLREMHRITQKALIRSNANFNPTERDAAATSKHAFERVGGTCKVAPHPKGHRPQGMETALTSWVFVI
jgi:hypothetical protein